MGLQGVELIDGLYQIRSYKCKTCFQRLDMAMACVDASPEIPDYYRLMAA
jgi:hypothetical protein